MKTIFIESSIRIKYIYKFRLYLSPKILSFISCAGVIFKQPEPNSISTYLSEIIVISLFVIGTITFLPI